MHWMQCGAMEGTAERMSKRCYTELAKIPRFEDRFAYLRLDGTVGADTFGFSRYLNQMLYTSEEWKRVRDEVILRDNGCDLGVEGYEINGRWIGGKYVRPKILIHHMNPITRDDILQRNPDIMNPEYLITTTKLTHDAIHYGDEGLLRTGPKERRPNDTCPWRR